MQKETVAKLQRALAVEKKRSGRLGAFVCVCVCVCVCVYVCVCVRERERERDSCTLLLVSIFITTIYTERATVSRVIFFESEKVRELERVTVPSMLSI